MITDEYDLLAKTNSITNQQNTVGGWDRVFFGEEFSTEGINPSVNMSVGEYFWFTRNRIVGVEPLPGMKQIHAQWSNTCGAGAALNNTQYYRSCAKLYNGAADRILINPDSGLSRTTGSMAARSRAQQKRHVASKGSRSAGAEEAKHEEKHASRSKGSRSGGGGGGSRAEAGSRMSAAQKKFFGKKASSKGTRLHATAGTKCSRCGLSQERSSLYEPYQAQCGCAKTRSSEDLYATRGTNCHRKDRGEEEEEEEEEETGEGDDDGDEEEETTERMASLRVDGDEDEDEDDDDDEDEEEEDTSGGGKEKSSAGSFGAPGAGALGKILADPVRAAAFPSTLLVDPAREDKPYARYPLANLRSGGRSGAHRLAGKAKAGCGSCHVDSNGKPDNTVDAVSAKFDSLEDAINALNDSSFGKRNKECRVLVHTSDGNYKVWKGEHERFNLDNTYLLSFPWSELVLDRHLVTV